MRGSANWKSLTVRAGLRSAAAAGCGALPFTVGLEGGHVVVICSPGTGVGAEGGGVQLVPVELDSPPAPTCSTALRVAA